jgi:hypothetical protein
MQKRVIGNPITTTNINKKKRMQKYILAKSKIN